MGPPPLYSRLTWARDLLILYTLGLKIYWLAPQHTPYSGLCLFRHTVYIFWFISSIRYILGAIVNFDLEAISFVIKCGYDPQI